MTDATALPSSPRPLIDWACLRACWRLGRAPFRYAGSDSAFTYLGAMLLVIAGTAATRALAPQFTFELTLLIVLACQAPAVLRRLRYLGAPVGAVALAAAFGLATAALTMRPGALPDLPLAWQMGAVALSPEFQGALLLLALAPARRQVGTRRTLRLGLLLAVAALSAGAAAAGIVVPA